MSFLPKEKQKSKSEPMICVEGLSAKRWMWVTRGGGLDVPGAGVAQMHAFLSDSEGHRCRTSHKWHCGRTVTAHF